MEKKKEEKKLTSVKKTKEQKGKEKNVTKVKKITTKEKPKKETKVKTPKKTYGEEVKAELKKVKWPTKQEMTKYSIAVFIFIILFGLYFYGLDAFFAWITSLVKGL